MQIFRSQTYPYHAKLCFRYEYGAEAMLEFPVPRQFVNILIQIRQKTTIVSILHNNHVLFCFWVLCDSINFKEFIIFIFYALGMVPELVKQ